MARLDPSGVLVVDKPHGITSHDVVRGLRRAYQTRRVGHTGTLDPMATGVLVAVLGEATKLSNHLTQSDKTYVAQVQFGTATDSLDAEGAVVDAVDLPVNWLDAQPLSAALAGELQRTEQVPPAHSAIQVDGQRAYAAARAGKPLALPPRAVSVRSAQVVSTSQDNSASIQLCVSKGYYVRAFARDLGARLGVPAHLTGLRRTHSGVFSLDEAHAFPPQADALPELIGDADAARRRMPTLVVTATGAEQIKHGRALAPEHFADGTIPRCEVCGLLSTSGTLLALATADGASARVVRGMRRP
ncbi:MAG TPA: tRNA pseudouridine(55) synthase TruB [Polyangiaceae bacterium]|nr:tRNA pseudouridine(55) synthase TruB [Polyangiaceae bacterium]